MKKIILIIEITLCLGFYLSAIEHYGVVNYVFRLTFLMLFWWIIFDLYDRAYPNKKYSEIVLPLTDQQYKTLTNSQRPITGYTKKLLLSNGFDPKLYTNINVDLNRKILVIRKGVKNNG